MGADLYHTQCAQALDRPALSMPTPRGRAAGPERQSEGDPERTALAGGLCADPGAAEHKRTHR